MIEAKALEKLAQPVGEFVTKIAGSPASELGEYVAEHIRLRRFKSSIRIMQKAEEYVRDAGLDPSIIPYKTLIPLLERGSLEDDEGMIERWAALLANASTNDASAAPSCPEILGQLAPVEARILDIVYKAVDGDQDGTLDKAGLSEPIASMVGLPWDRFEIHLENLYRLRLCTPPASMLGFIDNPENLFQLQNWNRICLTSLGRAFVRVCRPPRRG